MTESRTQCQDQGAKAKDLLIKEKAKASDISDKKLSYCWETVRRESMPKIAEMDVKMTT